MKVKVLNIVDATPVQSVLVKVDGVSIGNTDSSGEITTPAGKRVEVSTLFKGEWSNTSDKKVWVAGLIGISPPPPPPPPGGP